jgi:hypothetical protein
VDRVLDGTLADKLRAFRSEDPPRSFADIAYLLRSEHDIVVSGETVRRWCLDLTESEPTGGAAA